jgi:predicted TPR repeat methyltransferase
MKSALELHNESLDTNINKVDVYNKWAKSYDTYVESLDYNGPKNIVSYFQKLLKTNIVNNKKELKILDFGCGTGKVGEEIKKNINIPYFLEGVDISENMLELAKQKNVYNKITNIDLTKEKYNEKYDVILSSGVFLEGHVDIFNINRLCDLLNNNKGLIMFTIRNSFKETNKEDFLKYVINNKKFRGVTIKDIEYLKDVKCTLVILSI